MTDTKRAAKIGRAAKVEYSGDPKAYAEMLRYSGTAPLVKSPALLHPVPEPEFRASPQSRAASQQYIDSKRRPHVAPWFLGGVAVGMALLAALDAFLGGEL